MNRLNGFFELELESDGIPFLVTAEIIPPGLEESELKQKVVDEWGLHFGISAPVRLDTMKCVTMRPLPGKPQDTLAVPKGTIPVLIWKSAED